MFHLCGEISWNRGSAQSVVMDETFKIAVTRLRDRIHVGWMAELAVYSLKLRGGPRATLEYVVTGVFLQRERHQAQTFISRDVMLGNWSRQENDWTLRSPR